MSRSIVTFDGNEAAAYVAYNLSDVIAIYPITPSSPMGELADVWSAQGQKNLWNTSPHVMEMQSEGGAAGAVHGALQSGALSTTFTASQGLLLMIPNMYKIAGELTPAVFHVAARSLAAQALSIFCDHSDVMACRQTGFAILASSSVQECMDQALIAHSSTLESRIPFLHFFDGFRTSHEIMKIESLSLDDIRAMIDEKLVAAHRQRALTPDHPVIRGTAQNPDVYFQARESANTFYDGTIRVVQKRMDQFAQLTGRRYELFEYSGHEQAERVIVIMGSASETVRDTVAYLREKGDERIGVLTVKLYRPFSVEHLLGALPISVRSIAVLDRTKEPGSLGEPLYLDIVSALSEAYSRGTWQPKAFPRIIGGRYGLSSKEFTPSMVRAVFEELRAADPKPRFTIGINDDVSHLSLEYDREFNIEDTGSFRGIFIGLGSDGTVSANKNSIKIIGHETDNHAQGYFVYDSKKSGSITKSHLRFGKNPIRAPYLIERANFIACHQFSFLERFDVLEQAEEGGTFLLNSPYNTEEVWDHLPRPIQETIISKKIRLFIIDAYSVSGETGMGQRINTIMQTCFFAICGIVPKDEIIAKIKQTIEKTFGKRGPDVVAKNFRAVDEALAHLYEVAIPSQARGNKAFLDVVPKGAPDFVNRVTAVMMSGQGDSLPVSALPVDGTYPSGTTCWEKRAIGLEIPEWDPAVCIQCGKCAIACPHAVIRAKVYDKDLLLKAPSSFKSQIAKGRDWPEGTVFTIQVSPEDCTGCELCTEVCPARNKAQSGLKAINMKPFVELRDQEVENWNFFQSVPYFDRSKIKHDSVKGSQLLEPLFEFSGACSGCGETPYIKLVTQLYGDRMIVANATGCSSIYGGNLPTTPWTKNEDGRGPAWSNSLFEDNAEFGLGFRLTIDKLTEQAKELLVILEPEMSAAGVSVDAILSAKQNSEPEIYEQRKRVDELKVALLQLKSAESERLSGIADYLCKKSVWIIGGDGWGYDIGFGGLDHVIASGKNVNILLLDTEVYSNTGGQMSKSTPIGAVAKFAAGGKSSSKKDLGLIAMGYESAYVAKIALGANDTQAVRAIIEAERYEGPSLIIAYSHCIAHGYNMKFGMKQQKLAVDTGYWNLYRYNPDLAVVGENPLQLDSKGPKLPLTDYTYQETRFRILSKINPERALELGKIAQARVKKNWEKYEKLAGILPAEKAVTPATKIGTEG